MHAACCLQDTSAQAAYVCQAGCGLGLLRVEHEPGDWQISPYITKTPKRSTS
ncbi:hypothetical protein [Moraxella bovoculi]|uniref:hypothetical protein n=1 Tax=Moraxella bovoculi TaxID=386891 RepID=UPI001D0D0BE8|nr:hypothetical protein [Moraxella bovoculi]